MKEVSALQGQPQQHPTATAGTAGGLGQQLSPMGFGDRPGPRLPPTTSGPGVEADGLNPATKRVVVEGQSD